MSKKSKKNFHSKVTGYLEGIRVISFDVGFTLIYPHPPVGEVYANILNRFGIHFNVDEVNAGFMKNWKKAAALNRLNKSNNAQADEKLSYLWWKKIFQESLSGKLSAGDLEQVFKVVYEEFAKGEYWRLYPEVRQTLTTLKEKEFRLIILSNWDQRLLRTLDDLDMTHFFEKIYVSTLIGYAKPDPAAFQYVINDLKIPAQAILHIGDTLEEDIAGAQLANIHALYINRKGNLKPATNQMPTIISLDEILE